MASPAFAPIPGYIARPEPGDAVEYADGELLPMPNNDSVHDAIKARLATSIARQVAEPAIVGNEMAFDVTPVHVRHPDVAVLLRPPATAPGRKVQGAPDLAIEVVSDSDNAKVLDERVELYLDNGAAAVWVVWPHSRRVDIHQRDQPTRHLRSGAISGEAPIPEFRLELAAIFD